MRYDGREDPNTTKLGSFMIFQGTKASIAKKPHIFVIFQGEGGVWTPFPPSGSAHGNTIDRD